MSSIRVLALSSSRVGNSGYLEFAAPMINQFLGEKPLTIAFIPFAAADNDHAGYLKKVQDGLKDLPYTINVVEPKNAKSTIEIADAIMVGGGNTFKLLHDLYKYDVMELIKSKVNTGTPYIGWSAGANITGLTISTTNDMPIIEPSSFNALAFFPFQINPHYFNVVVEGHNGETRDQRLHEFLAVNPSIQIVALPEGTALQSKDQVLSLIGEKEGFLFHTNHAGNPVRLTIEINKNLNSVLENFSLNR